MKFGPSRAYGEEDLCEAVKPLLGACRCVADSLRPQDAGTLAERELFAGKVLLGMHPDQATGALVEAALRYGRPFAVLPCCVFGAQGAWREGGAERAASWCTVESGRHECERTATVQKSVFRSGSWKWCSAQVKTSRSGACPVARRSRATKTSALGSARMIRSKSARLSCLLPDATASSIEPRRFTPPIFHL